MRPSDGHSEIEDQTEDTFSWSRGVTWWLTTVAAIGITLVLAEGTESLFPGVWLLFAGGGLVWLGAFLGSARTGSWSTWDTPVRPTYFEGIMGFTGVVLATCPLIVLLIRFVVLYFKQKYA